jgi:polyisoprenoid-binding protein YceI
MMIEHHRDVVPTRRRAAAILAVGLSVLAAGSLAFARSSVTLDPRRTEIAFSIDAVGWPRTTGQFRAFDGRVTVDFDVPSRSSVAFRVQAASVDAGSAGITNFIRGESMLNTARFPLISFQSTNVARTGERSVQVTGDLSFYGATRPVTFEVDVESLPRDRTLKFAARGTVRRSDFGFISGQPLISDDVRITVSTIGRIGD